MFWNGATAYHWSDPHAKPFRVANPQTPTLSIWAGWENEAPDCSLCTDAPNSSVPPQTTLSSAHPRASYRHRKLTKTIPSSSLPQNLSRQQELKGKWRGEGGAFEGMAGDVWDLNRERHVKECTEGLVRYCVRMQGFLFFRNRLGQPLSVPWLLLGGAIHCRKKTEK
jgi:hypothetical protein